MIRIWMQVTVVNSYQSLGLGWPWLVTWGILWVVPFPLVTLFKHVTAQIFDGAQEHKRYTIRSTVLFTLAAYLLWGPGTIQS